MPCSGCAKRREWIKQHAEILKDGVKSVVHGAMGKLSIRSLGKDEIRDVQGNVVKRPPN